MVDFKLTKRQREIAEFIKHYAAKYGYPPTVREIGKAVGLASSSTVHAHLANLEKFGLRATPRSRGRSSCSSTRRGRRSAPAGCRSSARSPPVSRFWRRRTSRSTCRCRRSPVAPRASTSSGVTGESMRDAGILQDDYVVVRLQETAKNGDIVVALLGEDATVKRYFKEKDHIRLQPENETMEPIRSKDVRVSGKVVGVFRKIR